MTTAMVAYDEWGLLQIPTVSGLPFTPIQTGLWVAPANVPVADPCIAVMLDFLATWINTDGNAAAAWGATAGAAFPEAIKRILPHDPTKVVFEEKHLPALYMWRESSAQAWRGDDWLDDTTDVKVLWVFPLAQQANQRLREPFINAIGKLLAAGIERGRTPSWLQPTDREVAAKTQGSLFWPYAGFDRVDLVRTQAGVLSIASSDGKGSTDYPAVQIDLTLVENLVYGLLRYSELAPAPLTLSNGFTGALIVEGVMPTGDEDMVVAFPVPFAAGTTQSQTVVAPATRLTRCVVDVQSVFGAGAWLDLGNGTTPNNILDHTGPGAVDLTTTGLKGFDLDLSWNVPAPGLALQATIGGTASTTGLLNIIVSGSATPGN